MAGGAGSGESPTKRRTRKAIVEAAAGLLARGITPSMGEVADAAEVSRRTVYLYFPTLEQLLVDASLEAVTRATMTAALEEGPEVGAAADVEARVERAVRAFQALSAETEPYGRTILRRSLEPGGVAASEAPTPGAGDGPRRGYRRVEWLERALEPVRARLEGSGYERLVSALAMVAGWEALIVLRDVRGASAAEAAAISGWAARALVRAAQTEAEAAGS